MGKLTSKDGQDDQGYNPSPGHVVEIGDLTIENFDDGLLVYGDANFNLTAEGLAKAKRLQKLLNGAVMYMEYKLNSKPSVEEPSVNSISKVVKNPLE